MRMISLKYVNATQRNMIYYLATSSSNGAEVQSFIQSVFCRQSSFNNLKSLRLDCNNPRPSSTTSSKSLILNLGVLTPAEEGDNFTLWSHGPWQDRRLLSICFKLVVKLGMSNLRFFDTRNNLANIWKSLRRIIYHLALFLKRVRSSEFRRSFAGKIITKSCKNRDRLRCEHCVNALHSFST